MKKLLAKMFMDLDKIATPTARRIFLSDKPNPDKLREDEFSFFSSIKLENGTTKTTDRNRMRDVDAWFYEFLPKDKILNLLDVGVSSGITTVELCELFDANKTPYRITAMDSDLTAYLLVFDSGKSVLVDKQGNPIHFEMDGKGFGYVKGTNVRHRLERAVLKFEVEMLVKSRLKNDLREIKKVTTKNNLEIHPIKLVCREITENPAITLLEESIFADNSAGEKYGVIRAANILNKGYFNDSQLTEALQKLTARLEKNGFLLICRTNIEGENNASLFQLKEDKYHVAGRFGEGSEVENLVLGLSRAAPFN